MRLPEDGCKFQKVGRPNRSSSVFGSCRQPWVKVLLPSPVTLKDMRVMMTATFRSIFSSSYFRQSLSGGLDLSKNHLKRLVKKKVMIERASVQWLDERKMC